MEKDNQVEKARKDASAKLELDLFDGYDNQTNLSATVRRFVTAYQGRICKGTVQEDRHYRSVEYYGYLSIHVSHDEHEMRSNHLFEIRIYPGDIIEVI